MSLSSVVVHVPSKHLHTGRQSTDRVGGSEQGSNQWCTHVVAALALSPVHSVGPTVQAGRYLEGLDELSGTHSTGALRHQAGEPHLPAQVDLRTQPHGRVRTQTLTKIVHALFSTHISLQYTVANKHTVFLVTGLAGPVVINNLTPYCRLTQPFSFSNKPISR